MVRFSRYAILFLMLALITSFVAGCNEQNNRKETNDSSKTLNIATGGTAGTYYPIGGAMAEILNSSIEGMSATAQSTGASVANINMLQDGKVDLAIVQNDITYYAAEGIEMFKDKKLENLRAIATLYPETCQIITLEQKGINSITDLKGKKVAVGAAGSGVEANVRQILEAYGISYDDIDVQYLSFGEAVNALKDDNIDVAFITAGYPTAAVQDIASQYKIKLLPIDADKAEALMKKFPFYTKSVIPTNTYSGLDADVPSVSVMAMLITTDKMSDEVGTAVARALFDNLERLKASHSAAAKISKETATDGIPIKMNGGAEAFFK